jgi:Ca-activated chloride channel homolog
MLTDFHFLRPFWLLAAIPVLLLSVLLLFHRREQSPWHSLIAPHLQQVLLGGQLMLKKQPLALPLLVFCWLTTVLALAGPSWQKLPQPAFALKKATVLVLDMSMSMRATDMVPDRLTQLSFAALDFTEQLSEGELALLSFAGDAFVISPLTPDHNNIRLLIPDLKPEIMPIQGSNLLAALQQADKLLRQAGYPRGDIVVFTDGYDNNSYREIQDLLNNWSHRLSILGFGSADGAPVKLENGELLKNATGAVVIPTLPQQQLAALTKRSGGVYVQATTADSGISALLDLAPLTALDQADSSKQIQGDQWQDNAIYLVWLLLPLLLLQRKYSSLLTVVVAVTLLPPPAMAFEWRDLWQTQQQQAQQDYQDGAYSEAQQKFADPLWQGNAAYRNGDYQAAEQAFRQAGKQTPRANAWHNLGNSLAQQQRYEEALAAYQQALEQDADFSPAQQNAELMQQLLQQQQQQKQQQDKPQEQDGEKQPQQQSDNNSQNEDSADNQSEADAQSQQQADEQQDSAQNAEADSEAQQQAEPQTEQAAAQEQSEADANEQQVEAVHEAWPNATPEEQQQLDNLLRKVQDDPALLLRNKMYLEYLKRQQQRLPKGAEQQW